MQFTIDDVPALTDPRPAGAEPVKRQLPGGQPRWNRRGFMRAAATAGTGLGLASLGLFPPARAARADGYDVYGTCPSYAADHNCTPGCGPSAICYDCCTPACGSCYCPAWFKNSGSYRLRPNQCYASRYDAWVWKFAASCGCCRSYITYRCHDGYKLISGSWAKRICRSVVGCGACTCG